MFVPIYDINPLRRIRYPYVNFALIAINIAVFLLFQEKDIWTDNVCGSAQFARAFGIIPVQILGTPIGYEGCSESASGPIAFPPLLTLLTYMFLHGGLWHLISNMLFLWVFGDNIEDALGHVRYFVFYILCGIAGGLLYFGTQLHSTAPLVGASGAIAGVVIAYLILNPRVHLWVLAFDILPLELPAYVVLGFWVVANLVLAVLGLDSGVAYFAHVGGLIAGAILVVFLRRKGVPLFGRPPAPTRGPA